MPIIRIKNKVIYFSHIPKCGGTSIEDFLKTIAGTNLAFLDRNFYKSNGLVWSISSPQHITGSHVKSFFPITFFDEFFTVTRNPFDRFCSAFVFQKYFAKRISQEIDINQFVSGLDEYRALALGQFDHHFLPQVDFLYPGAPYTAFKLEYGLDGVKKYIGSLFDIDVSSFPMPHSLRQPSQIRLSPEHLNAHSKRIIMDIYKLDFEKFNY